MAPLSRFLSQTETKGATIGGNRRGTSTGSHLRPSVSPGAPLPHRVPSSWARCVGSDPVRLSSAPDFRNVAIAGEPRSYEIGIPVGLFWVLWSVVMTLLSYIRDRKLAPMVSRDTYSYAYHL